MYPKNYRARVAKSFCYFDIYIFECLYQLFCLSILLKNMLTLLDSGHLCILWPGSCQFNAKSINKKPVNISSQNMLCRGNQWTCFYIIGTSVMEELIVTSWSLNIKWSLTCHYWIQRFMNITTWKVSAFEVFLVRIFPH